MKARVLTAVVGIPVVLAVVGCTNPWPLAVLLLLVGLVSAIELSRLFGQQLVPLVGLAPTAAGLTSLGIQLSNAEMGIILSLFGAGIAGGLGLLRKSRHWAWLLLAGFWIGIPLFALRILLPGSAGWDWHLPNPLLILLLPVWAADIAAMLGGMAFGKHLLAPKISPKKTWEGAICNFLAAGLVGWAVGAWLGYAPWVGLGCGFAVGIFGQLGDLFESALKRAAGKKDSGTLLPGHGGILDRIDALLGSAIPVWLILHFSGSI